MIDDKQFIDRIARSLYAKYLMLNTDDAAWHFLEKKQKASWEQEAERFIDAANSVGIALYDVDDHR